MILSLEDAQKLGDKMIDLIWNLKAYPTGICEEVLQKECGDSLGEDFHSALKLLISCGLLTTEYPQENHCVYILKKRR